MTYNSYSYKTQHIIKLLIVTITLLLTASAFAQTPIYCGGVSGVADLGVTNNSDEYRADGGNIFLHSVGWDRSTEAQKNAIIALWQGHAYGIEMGYDDADYTRRQNAYVRRYTDRGIVPAFITCNAFSSDRVPVVSEWILTIDAYRQRGVTCPVYATFEYQNFPTKMNILASNLVSIRSDFQQIIAASGGLTLDIPPTVYFKRINSTNAATRKYHDFIIDAIKWAQNNGHEVGIIVSPNDGKERYDEDTRDFIEILRNENALPDFFIVENYSTEDPSTYPNEVGNEDTPHHQLGCARLMQTTWLDDAIVVNTPPLVDIALPVLTDNTLTVVEGYNLQIEANITDSENNFDNAVLFIDDNQIRTERNAPYEWGQNGSPNPDEVNGLQMGLYTIKVVATDERNETGSDEFILDVRQPKGPYSGIPIAIPGIIEAEDYDKGGEGVSYHETSVANRGGDWYRPNESVDIGGEATGIRKLGWNAVGEWTEYTVNVSEGGDYDFNILFSSSLGGGILSAFLDGNPLFENEAIPSSTDWDLYENHVVSNIALPAGEHIIRFFFVNNGFDIDKITVSKSLVTQTLELQVGWNLVSTYISANDNSITSVFPNASMVKTASGFYRNDQPEFLNTLNTIDAGKGYLVYNDVAETISVSGTLTVNHSSFTINPGWNLIGYPDSVSITFDSAFGTELQNIKIIKNFDGFWETTGAMNSIENMEPGKAYFVKK